MPSKLDLSMMEATKSVLPKWDKPCQKPRPTTSSTTVPGRRLPMDSKLWGDLAMAFVSSSTMASGVLLTRVAMGDIPAKTNMVSSIITFPLYGSTNIQSDTTFNITVQMSNLVAGSFTNADATYYAAPQQLSGGKVIGHTHVTVQDMGKTLNPTTALDPTQFAFFKGINDAGNGQGLLQATVTGGLPAGNYRVCTMASASNHQGVLMPVAQRGTADDCTKFTVSGSGTTENAAANDGKGGEAAAAAAQSAVDNPGPTNAAGGKGASSSATKASATTKAGNNGKASTSSEASTSSAAGKNGKSASSSASESSSATKAGKSASSSASESSATTNAGKGGKTEASVSAKATSSLKGALFTNTTSIASASANAGKGGKGAEATTTSEATSASVTLSSAGTATTTSKKISGGGKAVNSQSSSGTIVQKVTIIETFFIFAKSLGGLPPSVAKQGSQFLCLGELFADISAAASAACGHQFDACVGFSGPGFSFEECTSQQSECGASASVASAPPAPQTVTATVTVPVTATVTGTVISETTLSVSASAGNVAAVQTQAAGAESGAKAQTTAPALVASASASESACSVVTGTVTVDAPEVTKAAVSAPFSNSTSSNATATSSAPASTSSTATSTSGAIGGIEAPAIIDSGDATRPFSVNGNTFVNKSAAVQRSCDVQFNACANAVNGQKLSGVTLADCSAQQTKCNAQ
jgi:hypothetical protein